VQCEFTLPEPGAFQAVIFTSRHGVKALTSVHKSCAWLSMPVYAVGGSTARAAKKHGFQKVKTGCGGGMGLMPLILSDLDPDNGKLFWPSARSVSFDMATKLARFGFTVDRLPAYAMLETNNIGSILPGKLAKCKTAAVVAMSMRSLSLFTGLLDTADYASQQHKITVIAGSAVIAEAAGLGWAGIVVAKAPRRSRLLAIATLLHRRSPLLLSDS
jgi:uroporphyrinogen-III synthase